MARASTKVMYIQGFINFSVLCTVIDIEIILWNVFYTNTRHVKVGFPEF